eukprot:jgi/Mesen1/7507/ME000039S06727
MGQLAAEEPQVVVGRIFAKLRAHFPGEEPGAGAASIVRTLLQLQLTPKDVASIFIRHRPLYQAAAVSKMALAAGLVELVECLLAFGLTRREVGQVINANPHMLSSPSCQGWAGTVGLLREELQVARLSRVLTRWPHILSLKASDVRGVVEFLKEELGMRKVVGIVERHPKLLGRSIEDLREKAAALREILGGAALGPMLDRWPDLLYVSSAAPAASFRWLVDTLGEVEARRAVEKTPQLLTRKAEALERNRESYEWLAATFGPATTMQMVLQAPRLLTVPAALLQLKLEFVMGPVGCTLADVAEAPLFLTRNLETVLRPRADALRAIGLAHHFGLNTVYMASGNNFQLLLARWKKLRRAVERPRAASCPSVSSPSTTSTGDLTSERAAMTAPSSGPVLRPVWGAPKAAGTLPGAPCQVSLGKTALWLTHTHSNLATARHTPSGQSTASSSEQALASRRSRTAAGTALGLEASWGQEGALEGRDACTLVTARCLPDSELLEASACARPLLAMRHAQTHA